MPAAERIKKRREWLAMIVNKFEAASGTSVSDDRVRFFAMELDEDGYRHEQGMAAERWILRGAPVRFGKLTLADFFPTREQLAEVEFDMNSLLRGERYSGYNEAYIDYTVRLSALSDTAREHQRLTKPEDEFNRQSVRP